MTTPHIGEIDEDDDVDEVPSPPAPLESLVEPIADPSSPVEVNVGPKKQRGRPKKVNIDPSPPPEVKGKEEEAPRRSDRNAGKPSPMYSSTFINRANLEEEKGSTNVPGTANVARYDERPEWMKGYDDDLINYALIATTEQSDPRVPKSARQALKIPKWRESMKKE